MQELSGDSSSPKPQSTRGRGRPASDSIRIPWQVLELTGAASGGGAVAGGSVGEVTKPEDIDPNRSDGSSRRLVSHKRKHSQTIDYSPSHHPRSLQPQPVSPTKSPLQQEAPDDESPASGGDDVAAQEKAKIMEPSAAAVSKKEKIDDVEPFEAAKEKNEEDPSADADADEDDKDIKSVEAVEEKNEEDSSDDDDVTSKAKKEMESFEAADEETNDDIAVTDEKNKEMKSLEAVEEKNNEDEPSADAADDKGEKDKKAFETAEEKHEEEELTGVADDAGEKHGAESSDDAAEKPMKFLFDLNELPSGEEDDEDMP